MADSEQDAVQEARDLIEELDPHFWRRYPGLLGAISTAVGHAFFQRDTISRYSIQQSPVFLVRPDGTVEQVQCQSCASFKDVFEAARRFVGKERVIRGTARANRGTKAEGETDEQTISSVREARVALEDAVDKVVGES